MVRLKLVASLLIGVSLVAVGCKDSTSYTPVSKAQKAPDAAGHEHEHGEKGPHGGGIIELGEEEYHAELVVDHDSHAVTLYVLGKDGKTAEQVAAPEVTITPEGKDAITLKAAPQKEDAEGKASKFEVINEDVVHEWDKAGFVHGELRITIADKPYVGHIDYHLDGGGHHDHDEKKPADGAAK